MNESLRVLFLGTSEFAIPILSKLLKMQDLEVVGVVTQPDKPVGRKQELTPPPIKQYLSESNMPVRILQPEKVLDIKSDQLSELNPGLILTASYGQIIPKSILDYPKYGALNVHGSLLPKLRGAVPVQMAIKQGLSVTGVTLQEMTEKMDEGDIVAKKEVEISQDDNSETLLQKFAIAGADLVEESLVKYVEGEIKPTSQNDEEATYCYIKDLMKENAEIHPGDSVEQVERNVRAFYPWPIVWMRLPDGKRFKIYKAHMESELRALGDAMDLVAMDGQLGLLLKNGVLVLDEVQLEGKKRLSGKEYLYMAKVE